MLEAREQVFVAGVSHHTAPLDVRERIALDDAGKERLYGFLRDRGATAETLVLSTCNRTEVYGVGDQVACTDALKVFFRRESGISSENWENAFIVRTGEEVIRHLFEVCAGLNSQIVGETEILGQVKAAYRAAADRRLVGPVLHRLFQKGFQASKWVRSHTGIGVGQVSIGNVAVDLAVRMFGHLGASRVMVVGSGEVGAAVVKSLHSRGVGGITVTSRRPAAADALAGEVGAQSLPFEDWSDWLFRFDIIICSTGAPEPILPRAAMASAMRHRPGSPVFLIDVAVPRDVDPLVEGLEDVFLYNMDDLAAIANENLEQRHAEIARCREFLAERARRLAPLLQSSTVGATTGDRRDGR